MKLSEAIQRVSSLYNKGVQSDDTALKRRHIYSVLNTVRLQLISEYLQRGLKVPDDYSVTLDFQLIEEHNISDSSLYPLKDCGLYRTQCALPEPYFYNGQPLINYVSSVDGLVRFSKTDFLSRKYIGFSRFAGRFPLFFWKDSYIYVFNINLLKYVRICFIPQDFVAVYTNSCLQSECVTYDDIEFAAPDSDMEKIIDFTVQRLLATMLAVPQDTINDSVDTRVTTKTK